MINGDYSYDKELNIWQNKSKLSDFEYSDGDVNEEYVLDSIRGASDSSVFSDELFFSIRDWPSYYHLHSHRCNIFRPIMENIRGPILEIGAGCGALTRFLGEHDLEVFALEGSKRRATIIGERCRDQNNVSVININFQDFKPDKLFKTITLIGVLEYARIYFGDKNKGDPVDQMLSLVSQYLEPDGVLVVAIENQLGLKYFSGYPEDHLGVPMAGIEDRYRDDTVVTFGRHELSSRIKKCGLKKQVWGYPFPDYKFPEAVLFEDAVTSSMANFFTPIISAAGRSDRQKPKQLNFSLDRTWKTVARNGLLGDLANSFLILASKTPIKQDTRQLAVCFGSGTRKPEYQKEIRFIKSNSEIVVERQPLSKQTETKTNTSIQVLENEPFYQGVLWVDQLHKLMAEDSWSIEVISHWAGKWLDMVRDFTANPIPDDNINNGVLDGKYLDAIPRNLIFSQQGNWHFFDLEWRFPHSIKFKYLWIRGLYDSLITIEVCGVPQHNTPTEIFQLITEISKFQDIIISSADIENYWEQEIELQLQVTRNRGTVGSSTSNKDHKYQLPIRQKSQKQRTKKKRRLKRFIEKIRKQFHKV